MGLSYYYTFTAPLTVSASTLEAFLKKVEKTAIQMGFKPTMVLNAQFDTEQRREFAKRLTIGYPMTHERLKGVPMLKSDQVWDHDPTHGECRVIPICGVILILTNEQGHETPFAFFCYPPHLIDIHGKEVAPVEVGNCWFFRDFLDSPDARYRQIIRLFAEAGYLASELDEFNA